MRPSPEIDGAPLGPEPPLTRVVVPVRRSRTKTSEAPFVSPGTSVDASEAKATKRPVSDTEAAPLGASAPGVTDSTAACAETGAAARARAVRVRARSTRFTL